MAASGIKRAWTGIGFGILAAAAALAAPGQIGSMAGDWTGLKDLSGKTYDLKAYQGKVLLIMTVQWNCGGCNANAPRVGEIAKKFAGKNFQAFGPDINHGTLEQLKTFEKNLKKTATDVDFPLLMGIPDSQIVNTSLGTKWSRYDALRDVFFIVDHTGKISGRVDGNRGNTMGEDNYKKVETAIAAALAAIPTTAILAGGNADLCLRACKRGGQYQFDLTSGRAFDGDVALRILDSQGRLVRTVQWNPAMAESRQALWDGRDSRGRNVAWGSYFLNATGAGSSATVLLSWLP